MRGTRVDRVIGNVTFILQNARELGLDLRVRHKHFGFLRARPVADTRQKISNRISNSAHDNQAGCAAGIFARSLNGIPILANSELASSSVRVVVTIVTSHTMLTV